MPKCSPTAIYMRDARTPQGPSHIAKRGRGARNATIARTTAPSMQEGSAQRPVGVTTTSQRWKFLRSTYPVDAIARRNAPMKFVLPSAMWLGP